MTGRTRSTFRSIAAVLAGYLVFALLSFAIFRLSGHAPHAAASPSFMASSIAGGVVFAFLGGSLSASIAGRRPVAHAVAMAALLAIGAVASLALTIGHGAVWSQLSALALMVPAAVLGGWWCARQESVPET